MNKKFVTFFSLICLLIISLDLLVTYRFITNFFDALKTRRNELQKVHFFENYLSNLKDAETGQRGFVITGNKFYLAPYENALTNIHARDTKNFLFKEGSGIDREVAERVKKIQQLEQLKLNELKEVIEKRTAGGFDEARKEIEDNSDKLLMDNLRTEINEIIRKKEVELDLLDKNIAKSMSKTKQLLIAGNSIAALFIGLSLFSIFRSIKKVNEKDQQLSNTMQQLNESLAMREAIMNSTNYGIISVDQNGLITSFNSAAEKMIGYKKEEMIGKFTPVVFHDKDEIEKRAISLSKQAKKKILPGFEVFTFFAKENIPDVNEWTYIRKDGSRLPVTLSITAVKDSENQIVGYVGLFYDISERKEIDTMKNELISIVSHELRSPVVSIKGSLDLLTQTEHHLSEQSKKILALAQKNCHRLILLTDDLLDIQQIESGKIKFNFKKLNVSSFISHIVQSNSFNARQFSLKFNCPNVPKEWNIEADEDRLEQVMNNLLANAIKYSPQGGTIDINAKKVDSMIHFEIKDQGPGIPKELQSRIFQKFAHDTSPANKGKKEAGLGLSIAKSIVEKHKGAINFRTSSKGTTFWFEIPILKE